MKKFITLAAVLLCMAWMAVPAFAHGGHRAKTVSTTTRLCSVEDCVAQGVHTHSGTSYRCHYLGDGHDYHEACTVAGCTLTGAHEHDGEYYYCNTISGGGCCRR